MDWESVLDRLASPEALCGYAAPLLLAVGYCLLRGLARRLRGDHLPAREPVAAILRFLENPPGYYLGEGFLKCSTKEGDETCDANKFAPLTVYFNGTVYLRGTRVEHLTPRERRVVGEAARAAHERLGGEWFRDTLKNILEGKG